MALDRNDVAHIARLARIRVVDDELDGLVEELGRILSWVEQLEEVDTQDVAPMRSVVATRLKERPDTVTEGAPARAVVANAPAGEDHFFTVPKVIE